MGFTKRKKTAGFLAYTTDDIVLGTDTVDPQYFTNFTMIEPVGIKLEDHLTGTIKNTSGRIIKKMTGTISVDPNKDAGQTPSYDIFSERSMDGVTWTVNEFSRRIKQVSNTAESFGTLVSTLTNFLPNELVRFRCYKIGSASLSFESRSNTVKDGQTITTPSVAWELNEV